MMLHIDRDWINLLTYFIIFYYLFTKLIMYKKYIFLYKYVITSFIEENRHHSFFSNHEIIGFKTGFIIKRL